MGVVEFRNFDAARRFNEAIALHQTVLSKDELIARRFIAVALADGRTDGTAYESRADAMRHQRGHPALYLYFQLPVMNRPGIRECDSLIWYARSVYDAGYRPQLEGAELIIPNDMDEIEEWADAARRNHLA
jgi:hypothetical protein